MKTYAIPTLLCFMLCVNAMGARSEKRGKLFVDNEVIRLGIDLKSGGSIFYFSKADEKRNLLNHFDRGRFIQQSYYGDEDDSHWAKKKWRWNPVQGGDYKGHPAELLEHKSTKTTLYARSVPKHWANGSNITSAVMEQWILLTNDVAHVRYRFAYTGEQDHEPHRQEMPAVFVDYAFTNLVFYQGTNPWEQDKLSTVVPGWPNEDHHRSEQWSAYVDDKSWGIGVYTPETSDMSCYRHKGKDGPKGSGCSYFAPIRTLAITNGLMLEYDVYLTIGSVSDIRKRFYEIHSTDCGKTPTNTCGITH